MGDTKSMSAKAYANELHRLLLECEVSDGAGREIDLEMALERTTVLLSETQSLGRKVLAVGNGGSAAIVSHMQNDLFKCDGIRSMVLTETPLLTAYSNDDGYEVAYSTQIERWAERDDVLVAVSSSGSSNNILYSVEAAQKKGMAVVTFSGFDEENPLRAMGDLNFYVRSKSYGMVEMAHSVLCHMITDRLAINASEVQDAQVMKAALAGGKE